jgi:hypothetical protein
MAYYLKFGTSFEGMNGFYVRRHLQQPNPPTRLSKFLIRLGESRGRLPTIDACDLGLNPCVQRPA